MFKATPASVTFQGRAPSEPFTVAEDDVTATPRGRAARLQRAAAEALPTALALREQVMSQGDGTAPVLLVCAVDCPLGRQLVEARWGAMAPHSLCGPVVFALTMPELAATFGAVGPKVATEAKALADGADGASLFAFAVNGMGLDLRVMVPATPAPVADVFPIPTGEGLTAEPTDGPIDYALKTPAPAPSDAEET